jgi:hypothetical protein
MSRVRFAFSGMATMLLLGADGNRIEDPRYRALASFCGENDFDHRGIKLPGL